MSESAEVIYLRDLVSRIAHVLPAIRDRSVSVLTSKICEGILKPYELEFAENLPHLILNWINERQSETTLALLTATVKSVRIIASGSAVVKQNFIDVGGVGFFKAFGTEKIGCRIADDVKQLVDVLASPAPDTALWMGSVQEGENNNAWQVSVAGLTTDGCGMNPSESWAVSEHAVVQDPQVDDFDHLSLGTQRWNQPDHSRITAGGETESEVKLRSQYGEEDGVGEEVLRLYETEDKRIIGVLNSTARFHRQRMLMAVVPPFEKQPLLCAQDDAILWCTNERLSMPDLHYVAALSDAMREDLLVDLPPLLHLSYPSMIIRPLLNVINGQSPSRSSLSAPSGTDVPTAQLVAAKSVLSSLSFILQKLCKLLYAGVLNDESAKVIPFVAIGAVEVFCFKIIMDLMAAPPLLILSSAALPSTQATVHSALQFLKSCNGITTPFAASSNHAIQSPPGSPSYEKYLMPLLNKIIFDSSALLDLVVSCRVTVATAAREPPYASENEADVQSLTSFNWDPSSLTAIEIITACLADVIPIHCHHYHANNTDEWASPSSSSKMESCLSQLVHWCGSILEDIALLVAKPEIGRLCFSICTRILAASPKLSHKSPTMSIVHWPFVLSLSNLVTLKVITSEVGGTSGDQEPFLTFRPLKLCNLRCDSPSPLSLLLLSRLSPDRSPCTLHLNQRKVSTFIPVTAINSGDQFSNNRPGSCDLVSEIAVDLVEAVARRCSSLGEHRMGDGTSNRPSEERLFRMYLPCAHISYFCSALVTCPNETVTQYFIKSLSHIAKEDYDGMPPLSSIAFDRNMIFECLESGLSEVKDFVRKTIFPTLVGLKQKIDQHQLNMVISTSACDNGTIDPVYYNPEDVKRYIATIINCMQCWDNSLTDKIWNAAVAVWPTRSTSPGERGSSDAPSPQADVDPHLVLLLRSLYGRSPVFTGRSGASASLWKHLWASNRHLTLAKAPPSTPRQESADSDQFDILFHCDPLSLVNKWLSDPQQTTNWKTLRVEQPQWNQKEVSDLLQAVFNSKLDLGTRTASLNATTSCLVSSTSPETGEALILQLLKVSSRDRMGLFQRIIELISNSATSLLTLARERLNTQSDRGYSGRETATASSASLLPVASTINLFLASCRFLVALLSEYLPGSPVGVQIVRFLRLAARVLIDDLSPLIFATNTGVACSAMQLIALIVFDPLASIWCVDVDCPDLSSTSATAARGIPHSCRTGPSFLRGRGVAAHTHSDSTDAANKSEVPAHLHFPVPHWFSLIYDLPLWIEVITPTPGGEAWSKSGLYSITTSDTLRSVSSEFNNTLTLIVASRVSRKLAHLALRLKVESMSSRSVSSPQTGPSKSEYAGRSSRQVISKVLRLFNRMAFRRPWTFQLSHCLSEVLLHSLSAPPPTGGQSPLQLQLGTPLTMHSAHTRDTSTLLSSNEPVCQFLYLSSVDPIPVGSTCFDRYPITPTLLLNHFFTQLSSPSPASSFFNQLLSRLTSPPILFTSPPPPPHWVSRAGASCAPLPKHSNYSHILTLVTPFISACDALAHVCTTIPTASELSASIHLTPPNETPCCNVSPQLAIIVSDCHTRTFISRLAAALCTEKTVRFVYHSACHAVSVCDDKTVSLPDDVIHHTAIVQAFWKLLSAVIPRLAAAQRQSLLMGSEKCDDSPHCASVGQTVSETPSSSSSDPPSSLVSLLQNCRLASQSTAEQHTLQSQFRGTGGIDCPCCLVGRASRPSLAYKIANRSERGHQLQQLSILHLASVTLELATSEKCVNAHQEDGLPSVRLVLSTLSGLLLPLSSATRGLLINSCSFPYEGGYHRAPMFEDGFIQFARHLLSLLVDVVIESLSSTTTHVTPRREIGIHHVQEGMSVDESVESYSCKNLLASSLACVVGITSILLLPIAWWPSGVSPVNDQHARSDGGTPPPAITESDPLEWMLGCVNRNSDGVVPGYAEARVSTGEGVYVAPPIHQPRWLMACLNMKGFPCIKGLGWELMTNIINLQMGYVHHQPQMPDNAAPTQPECHPDPQQTASQAKSDTLPSVLIPMSTHLQMFELAADHISRPMMPLWESSLDRRTRATSLRWVGEPDLPAVTGTFSLECSHRQFNEKRFYDGYGGHHIPESFSKCSAIRYAIAYLSVTSAIVASDPLDSSGKTRNAASSHAEYKSSNVAVEQLKQSVSSVITSLSHVLAMNHTLSHSLSHPSAVLRSWMLQLCRVILSWEELNSHGPSNLSSSTFTSFPPALRPSSAVLQLVTNPRILSLVVAIIGANDCNEDDPPGEVASTSQPCTRGKWSDITTGTLGLALLVGLLSHGDVAQHVWECSFQASLKRSESGASTTVGEAVLSLVKRIVERVQLDRSSSRKYRSTSSRVSSTMRCNKIIHLLVAQITHLTTITQRYLRLSFQPAQNDQSAHPPPRPLLERFMSTLWGSPHMADFIVVAFCSTSLLKLPADAFRFSSAPSLHLWMCQNEGETNVVNPLDVRPLSNLALSSCDCDRRMATDVMTSTTDSRYAVLLADGCLRLITTSSPWIPADPKPVGERGSTFTGGLMSTEGVDITPFICLVAMTNIEYSLNGLLCEKSSTTSSRQFLLSLCSVSVSLLLNALTSPERSSCWEFMRKLRRSVILTLAMFLEKAVNEEFVQWLSFKHRGNTTTSANLPALLPSSRKGDSALSRRGGMTRGYSGRSPPSPSRSQRNAGTRNEGQRNEPSIADINNSHKNAICSALQFAFSLIRGLIRSSSFTSIDSQETLDGKEGSQHSVANFEFILPAIIGTTMPAALIDVNLMGELQHVLIDVLSTWKSTDRTSSNRMLVQVTSTLYENGILDVFVRMITRSCHTPNARRTPSFERDVSQSTAASQQKVPHLKFRPPVWCEIQAVQILGLCIDALEHKNDLFRFMQTVSNYLRGYLEAGKFHDNARVELVLALINLMCESVLVPNPDPRVCALLASLRPENEGTSEHLGRIWVETLKSSMSHPLLQLECLKVLYCLFIVSDGAIKKAINKTFGGSSELADTCALVLSNSVKLAKTPTCAETVWKAVCVSAQLLECISTVSLRWCSDPVSLIETLVSIRHAAQIAVHTPLQIFVRESVDLAKRLEQKVAALRKK
eukprot:GHVN01001032.1.p1 GENE.GHVN01001032.1~~GHVN01001032.1.p1  ORF type:complete len:3090 (+),score=307.60 GHVN01001032.1:2465-11734(+)